jgi:hypothetical protein
MFFAMTYSEIMLTIIPVTVAFLTGVAGPIAIHYIKHALRLNSAKLKEIEKRKKDFHTTLETQKLINEALNQIQTKFNLDRIWVAQFHNGGNFYPGNKSMKKMSITFESTAPGISTELMSMQSMPVSFFSTALQKLNNTNERVVIDVYNETDHALRAFWETKGVHTVYMYPIKSLENLFIGILCVDFVNKDAFLTDSVQKELEREANLLSGYVDAISVDKG